jgi:hypothetical protein
MKPENPLTNSLTCLLECFASRRHEIDPTDQKKLLDALQQLYAANESLKCQLQSLAAQLPEVGAQRPVLFLVK